jgi:hypothetical protein
MKQSFAEIAVERIWTPAYARMVRKESCQMGFSVATIRTGSAIIASSANNDTKEHARTYMV